MRRTLPTGMAVGDKSGSMPIRTATSMPSSSIDTTRSTSNARPRIAAYRLRKRVSIGVTCNLAGAQRRQSRGLPRIVVAADHA